VVELNQIRIRFEGLRKPAKIVSKDIRSPDRDLNPGLSEYEARALPDRLQLSIFECH
jgi:hypothetical protein